MLYPLTETNKACSMSRDNEADLENQLAPGHTDTVWYPKSSSQPPNHRGHSLLSLRPAWSLLHNLPPSQSVFEPQAGRVTLEAHTAPIRGGLTPCLDPGGQAARVTRKSKVGPESETSSSGRAALVSLAAFWNVFVTVTNVLQTKGVCFLYIRTTPQLSD